MNSFKPLMMVIIGVSFSLGAKAAVQIPRQLDAAERKTALSIIGLGMSSKLLSDPYPLGGYLGFELGYSVENLPAEDLGRLGGGLPAPQQDVTVSKFSIGKGLYNNVDVFFQFTPYTSIDEMSQYGGLVRWGFFQSKDLPLTLSTAVHFNNANISNKMTTNSYGVDWIGGVIVEQLSLFAGIGLTEASGTFVGGSSGVTESGKLEREVMSGTHTVIGADIRFSGFFLSLQIDRYALPVFSGKVGVRF